MSNKQSQRQATNKRGKPTNMTTQTRKKTESSKQIQHLGNGDFQRGNSISKEEIQMAKKHGKIFIWLLKKKSKFKQVGRLPFHFCFVLFAFLLNLQKKNEKRKKFNVYTHVVKEAFSYVVD